MIISSFSPPSTIFPIRLGRLINGIEDLKKALAYKYGHLSENTEDVNAQIDNCVVSATSESRKFKIIPNFFQTNNSSSFFVSWFQSKSVNWIAFPFECAHKFAPLFFHSRVSFVFSFFFVHSIENRFYLFEFCLDHHKWISIESNENKRKERSVKDGIQIYFANWSKSVQANKAVTIHYVGRTAFTLYPYLNCQLFVAIINLNTIFAILRFFLLFIFPSSTTHLFNSIHSHIGFCFCFPPFFSLDKP